jgi:hypothetical protein
MTFETLLPVVVQVYVDCSIQGKGLSLSQLDAAEELMKPNVT